MLPDHSTGASSEELSVRRLYALLYKMAADIERLEALLRTIKKNTEEIKAHEQEIYGG